MTKLLPGPDDISVRAKESDGLGAGAPGDLYVVVHVEDDPRFEREGADLHSVLWLTFPQAALGDRVAVAGLTGELEAHVRAGTQPGHEFRFKGEGLPRLHGGSRGSLFVRAQIAVPEKVSEEEALLLRQYAEKSGGPVPKGDEGGLLGSLFGKKKKK